MRISRMVLLLLPFLFHVVALADTVTCVDGRVFEGEVLEEDETQVKIRTATGTVALPRAEIKTVTYQESPIQSFKKRRAKLASDDAKGRWELAAYCLQHKLRREAEDLLTEIISMASPFYKKALMQLAEIVAAKDPKRAVVLLDGLADQSNDAEARVLARDIKRTLDAKRQAAYDLALASLQQKQWQAAIENLRYAYLLSYPRRGADTGAKLTEDEVLTKLAEVRRDLELLVRQRSNTGAPASGVEVPAPVQWVCTKCPKASGWRTCAECSGQGRVQRIVPAVMTATGTIPEKKVVVDCPTCGAKKLARCPDCSGSGLELTKLTARLRMIVRTVASQAWERANDEASHALKDALGTVVRDKLKLPESYAPNYATTQKLRDLLPAVPTSADWPKGKEYLVFVVEWKKTSRQDRGQFLCQYAFECAKNVLPQAGAAGTADDRTQEVPDAAQLDINKIRLTAPTVTPTEMSALPEDWAGKWVWCGALFKARDGTFSGTDRKALLVESPKPHNLHPFVFVEEAKRSHATVAREPNAPPYLATLVTNYPYSAMTRRTEQLKEGDFVQMFGRVLFRKDRDPETSLEIWDFDITLDPRTQALLSMIRKPVTFHFEETPLTEVAELLALLTNTKIKVEVPEAERPKINARATQEPLAFALRDVLKDHKLEWVFDETQQGLKIVAEPKPEESDQREKITRHLK